MTDNGSGYVATRLRRYLPRARARAICAPGRYTPRTNGKAERFIQTLLREWAYARPYRTSNQRTKRLDPVAALLQPPTTPLGPDEASPSKPLLPALLVIVASILLSWPRAGHSQELFACVRAANGNIRMVASPSECKARSETAVSWNVVGPEGPAGPPGSGSVSLFEANGHEIGLFLGLTNGDHPLVYVREPGVTLSLFPSGLGLSTFGLNGVAFLEANCQGQPYLITHELDQRAAQLFCLSGCQSNDRFFFATPGVSAQVIMRASILTGGGCFEGVFSSLLVPAVEVLSR